MNKWAYKFFVVSVFPTSNNAYSSSIDYFSMVFKTKGAIVLSDFFHYAFENSAVFPYVNQLYLVSVQQ